MADWKKDLADALTANAVKAKANDEGHEKAQ